MEQSTEPHTVPGWRWWGLALLTLLLSVWVLWPRPAFGVDVAAAPQDLEARGANLFARHCVGCHVNGGNVIRRGKTLRLSALKRAGLEGPEAIARVAALGQGQMGGYGTVLGEDGAQAVGAWVWSQALADWPKSAQKTTIDFP
jgi:cytochrome c6